MKTNAERTDATRNKILKKAMELFVSKGYHNTSIRDIANESKMSTGAIFHHFKNKEEIAIELFNYCVSFLNNLFDSIINLKAPTVNKIKELVFSLLNVANNDRVMLEYALNVKHSEIIKDGKPICSSGPFETLRIFLENEIKQGNIKKINSYIATICLTGIPIRLIQLHWDNVIKEDLDNYKDLIFESVWETLKP
jgi:AcrR family transcriptional regulator